MELVRGAHKLLSVRARLVAFALLCAVPVLVLTGLQLHRDGQRASEDAADQARLLAERLQLRLEQVIGSAESVTHAIGVLDVAGDRSGTGACAVALARALSAAGPLASNFSYAAPDGAVLCSAVPHISPVNIGDRAHFQEAVTQRKPVLSPLTLGKLLSHQLLLLAVPILDARGEVKAVASAALNGPAMAQGLLPDEEEHTAVAVLDRDGVLVSRWPAHPQLRPGQRLGDTPLGRHLELRGFGSARLPGLDGIERQYVTRVVSYRGEPVLWVAVGVDVSSLEALSRASRWRDLALVLLLAAAVALVAVAATRPLVLARVRALVDVAGQVSRGELGRRVPVQVHDDLTPVEEALNHMLDAVQADRSVLADSESRYRMLFEHSLDGVLQTTPDGAVLAANPAACRLLGRSEAELVRLGRQELVDPRDERLPALLRERAEAGRSRGELTMLRGDGSRIEVAIASSLYRSSDGRELSCIVFHDMTERNAAREQVLRLNRELEARVARRTQELQAANRELEAFSYSVSHDLRAPVAVIRSFAEVLESHDVLQDEKHRHYLRRIRASGELMSGLIDGLLALAHVSRTALEWGVVDMSAVAREVAQQLSDTHPGHAVALDIAPGMHAVGDARLLRVVVFNLMANAWKFSSQRAQPVVQVSARGNDAGLPVFCVQDNGDGFDPAHAHRLFAPFHRLHAATEFPGLGIGLAIVHRIVQRHGGRIWAEGRPGSGAAFYFELGGEEGARPSAAPPPAFADSRSGAD